MLFTSVVLVLIVCFLLLINNWSLNKGIIYLVSGILIICARELSMLLSMSSGHTNIFTFLIIHFDPLASLAGPLLYYFFKSLVKGKLVIDYYFLLFAVPAMVVLANTLPYYFFPWESKVAYFTQLQLHIPYILPNHFPSLLFPYHFQRSFIALCNLGFIIFALRYLIIQKRNSTVYMKKKLTQLINHFLLIVPLVVLPLWGLVIYATSLSTTDQGLVFRNKVFISDGYLYYFILIMPISFLFMPKFLYGDQNKASLWDKFILTYKRMTVQAKGFQEAPHEKSEDLDRIVAYIETEKPYLNTTFSLHDISRTLNIPHIRVTTCFSKQLKVPFPAYRNKLRVEHATDLFRSGAHLTTSIEGIAAMSGFKSKSIFYTAFKAVYGVNPMEWMKENL